MGGVGHVFLRESFEKLTVQMYRDFEVVISDYSKTPFVKQLCEEYRSKLSIQYYVNTDPTGGMAANANNAIRHAKGKIIKIVFQDDFLFNEKSLQIISDNFDLQTDTWLATGCEHTSDGKSFYRPHYPKYNRNVFKGKNTIGAPSVIAIKNDHPLFFDPKLKWLVDCDFYKRYHDAFGPPKLVNAITVAIRTGDHQITNTEATEKVRKEELEYVVNKFKKSAQQILQLPDVTLVAVSSIKIPETIRALEYSMQGIQFGRVLLISHEKPKKLPRGIDFQRCEKIQSIDSYSRFMAYELRKYITTEYALVIQYDGFVVRPKKWEPNFFRYDYIAAPWPKDTHYTSDGKNVRVGNGGFSLRSKKLLNVLHDLQLPFTDNGTGFFNEDGIICVYYRKQLEEYGIQFAPVEVASRFSKETNCEDSIPQPFGFHKNTSAIPFGYFLGSKVKKALHL